MKRCPVCQKTYADSMRFCQIDGTLLVEETDDPYKTTIGNPAVRDDDENLLQLPTDSEQFNKTDSAEQYAKKEDSLFENPTEQISSPFDSPAYQPPPSFIEPNGAQNPESPFGTPQTPFNQTPFDQYQEPTGQPIQQSQWTPPPAPEAGWQNQNIGANTPFQPPAIQGQNQTLPIISLVCGVLAFVLICCYGGVPFGIAALITGFLGIQNFNKDSVNFSGKGLAIAGMILGGISLALTVVFFIFGIALGTLGNPAN